VKSLRLDTDSVRDAIESWPALLVAAAICALLMYLGWFDAAWRGVLVAFGAVYFGYALRGTITKNLRSEYPNASCIWLLSIGLCSGTIGVVTRMLFPLLQGGLTDYVWIAISFTTILAFVISNRRDQDVLK